MQYQGLFNKTSGGKVTIDYLFNQLRTDVVSSIGEFRYQTFHELKHATPKVAAALEEKLLACKDICLYQGTGHSIQSNLCSGHSIPGSEQVAGEPCCSGCLALMLDRTLLERAQYPSNQIGAELSKFARHDTVGTMGEAIKRLRKSSATISALYKKSEKDRRLRIAAERRANRLESKLNAAIQQGKYPKFIRAFQAAIEDGCMPEERLQNILEDIAKSLRGKHTWSADSKSFYTCLLNCGNPFVTKFVSLNLLGMDIRTVEEDRQKRRHDFLAGKVSANIRHVAEMMAKYYHMKGVPCCVVEDATTVLLRLDCYLKTNPITGGEEVWVQGFTSPLKVEKFTDLEDYFRDNKHDAVARYVYVWSLVPQLPNSPYWPIFMVASNNKFTARWVYEWWEYIVQEAVLCEISLIGFNHDGDSRCRKGDFQLNLHSVCNRMHILGSDGQPHPFMYLSIGELHAWRAFAWRSGFFPCADASEAPFIGLQTQIGSW